MGGDKIDYREKFIEEACARYLVDTAFTADQAACKGRAEKAVGSAIPTNADPRDVESCDKSAFMAVVSHVQNVCEPQISYDTSKSGYTPRQEKKVARCVLDASLGIGAKKYARAVEKGQPPTVFTNIEGLIAAMYKDIKVVAATPPAPPVAAGDSDDIGLVADGFQKTVAEKVIGASTTKGITGADADYVRYFAEELYWESMVLLPQADRDAKAESVATQILEHVGDMINGISDTEPRTLKLLKGSICGTLVAWKNGELSLIDVSTQLFQGTQLLEAQAELRRLLFEAQRKVSSNFDVSGRTNAAKLADAVYDKAATMARATGTVESEEAFAEYLRGLKVTNVTVNADRVLTSIVMKYASVHQIKIQEQVREIAGPKTEAVMEILLRKESYGLVEGEDTPELWEDIIRAYGQMVVSCREGLRGQRDIETKVQNALVDLARRTVAAARAELEKSRGEE